MTPYFSGRASNMRMKLAPLHRSKHIIHETKWLPRSGSSAEANRQYDALLESIELAIQDLYREWIQDIGDNPKGRLARYLMRRRSTDKLIPPECDIDPAIPKLCREAAHWLSLGFDVPTHITLIHGKWHDLQFLQESVLAIVLAYQEVLRGISELA